MDIKKLTLRHGDGTYRIDESDNLVVIEDIEWESNLFYGHGVSKYHKRNNQ